MGSSLNFHFFQQMEILVTLSSGLEFVTFELEIVSIGAIDLLNNPTNIGSLNHALISVKPY